MNPGTIAYPRPQPFPIDPPRPIPDLDLLGPKRPGDPILPAPVPPAPITRGPAASELTESERRTLRRAVAVIKSARADSHSSNPKVAGPAAQRLVTAVCYVAGFLDGKAAAGAALNPGFQSIVQSSLVTIDAETALDDFQKQLEELSEGGATRLWKQIVGAGLIVAGILLKQV